MDFVIALFFVVLAAVFGGVLAKKIKLPVIVGYILTGIVLGAILPQNQAGVTSLAELGTILLLFSVGVELSFDRLAKFLKVSVLGSIIQIILVTAIGFLALMFFRLDLITSLVLALGFSLSSTAVVVKILGDRGELDTIHGEIMLGWLLVQDLAVIPMMVILPVLGNLNGGWIISLGLALGKAIVVVAVTVVLGKLLAPWVIHKVAETNSRELLVLTATALALGVAGATSYFGISPALGAFLAGVVISESQEHHAIFAETRPLRDLFVAMFFVTLGFLVSPGVIVSHLGLIVALVVGILIVKAIVVFLLSVTFGFRGKVAIANSFGLAQVGEFAFVIFSAALGLGLIDSGETSIGIAVTLLTLVFTPLLFSWVVPFWRKMKDLTSKNPSLSRIFSTREIPEQNRKEYSGHIIICGYGRVGKWVGKALSEFGIPFVVVEYDRNIVGELTRSGVEVLYGDPSEPEVMEAVNVRDAKAVILAIPDRVAQETLIAYVQTVAPDVKIISRVHQDADWEKLKALRVNKIVQPEFEAALAIVRSVFIGMGKSKEEIGTITKKLRLVRSSK